MTLAAQNAVVALEALGLGGVYIGAIRKKPVEVVAELGLPPSVFALFGLVVGWPDPRIPTDIKPGLPQRAIVFQEQYGFGDEQRNAIADYDQRIRAFQREQQQPEQDWTVQAAKRVLDARALNGRDTLFQALQWLGFALR